MSYDYNEKRSVMLLAPSLSPAVALNVAAHLATSVAAAVGPDMIGRPQLLDGSGEHHLGIAKYPIIIKVGRSAKIQKAIAEARQIPGIIFADYPREVLSSGHDDELAATMSKMSAGAIEYFGALFFGPKASVDTICGRFALWNSKDDSNGA